MTIAIMEDPAVRERRFKYLEPSSAFLDQFFAPKAMLLTDPFV
jgi:hypothetical protein